MTFPVVVMDEAGHTGENLLDGEQPVYALAAVRLDPAVADVAVTAALERQRGGVELKFSRLRRSSVGRRNILALLEEVKATPDDAAIIVVHKPWMLAGS